MTTDDTRRAEELCQELRDHAWLERFRKANYENGYANISPIAANQIAGYVDGCLSKIAAALLAARDEGLEEAAKVAGEYYARYVTAMLSERYTDGEKAKASAAKTYACNDIAAAIRSLKSKGGE